jgi:hypothetical protein
MTEQARAEADGTGLEEVLSHLDGRKESIEPYGERP